MCQVQGIQPVSSKPGLSRVRLCLGLAPIYLTVMLLRVKRAAFSVQMRCPEAQRRAKGSVSSSLYRSAGPICVPSVTPR